MPNFLAGLSEYQRAFLSSYPPCQVFAVISWGCAGTGWIARVLGSHPDVYCVHSANLFWHVLGGAQRIDGLPYLRVIASQAYAYSAAGDVHGVGRHHVPELRRAFEGLFNAAVIVREPIPRLHSQIALFQRYAAVDGAQAAWDLSYVDGIVSRCRLALPQDDRSSRLFVHAANMLNAILEERDVGKIYRSEDLTAKADVLGEFIGEITRNRVEPTREWLEAAVKTHRVNTHVDGDRPSPFLDWQIDILRKVVDPRSWEQYELLGYPTPEFVRRRTF